MNYIPGQSIESRGSRYFSIVFITLSKNAVLLYKRKCSKKIENFKASQFRVYLLKDMPPAYDGDENSNRAERRY